jgi:hypothetical protein
MVDATDLSTRAATLTDAATIAAIYNMCDVLGIMARLPGNGNQADPETFVDPKLHDTAMVSSRRPSGVGL